MTTEEKARAYDGALEVMRQWIAPCHTKEQLDTLKKSVFPELAESEDERIRKEIVSIVQSYRDSCISEGTHRFDDCLAWLEKQKDLDKMIVISPEVWDNAITDAYENGKRDSEKQKEQKPVESISQLTVQGKGVYKICPRCKERMVRDDSMVYTSMPPQYRYECPKCGESECDTVMYDNPEMEEQRPVDYEAELKKCKDNPLYFYDKYVSIKLKPAEWSEEDEKMLKCCLIAINHYEKTCNIGDHLPTKFNIDGYLASVDKVKSWLKSLRPSWKPSEEQMKALKETLETYKGFEEYDAMKSLYEHLKKL